MDEQPTPTEEDRMIAIIKGSYIAKHYPHVWYQLEMRKRDKKSLTELEAELTRRMNGPKHPK